MNRFVSTPPSSKPAPEGEYFADGLQVAKTANSGLIIYDLRSLNLPVADGQAIEGLLRKALFDELDRRGVSQNRGAIDLSTAVHGVAID